MAYRDKFINWDTGVPVGAPDSITAIYTGSTDITANIPVDNTIPQITEGIEVLTATLTPARVTNRLIIRVSGVYANNTVNGTTIFALFKDNDVNAIRSIFINSKTADDARMFYTTVTISPATISPVTIRLRVGADVGQIVRPNKSGVFDLGGGSQAWTLNAEELLS